MTRVAVVSDLWPPFPGGAERLAFNIARHAMRAGCDVEVFTGYEAARRFDGPPVTIRPFPVGADAAAGAVMMLTELDRFRPDVVVGHHLYAYAYERALADAGYPFVQVVLNTRRIAHAAHAAYISRWVMDDLGDAAPGDVVMLPPALDDVVAAAHEHAVGFVKPLPHKGVDLVYAVARLMPGRRFVILRGEWQTLETIRPAANITFMDPVADIRDFWRAVDVVLVPSLSEDAGTVGQEATANGVPCLSSDRGGLAETNAGGVFLNPDRPRDWVRAIRRLDAPAAYVEQVTRQRLAAPDPVVGLDALVRRLVELGTA